MTSIEPTTAAGRALLDEFGPMTYGPGCGPHDHPVDCQCPYPVAAAERDRLAELAASSDPQEPQTATGRAMAWGLAAHQRRGLRSDRASIARIEAEAIAAERARMRAAVEELRVGVWDPGYGQPWFRGHNNGLDAVLALLDPT